MSMITTIVTSFVPIVFLVLPNISFAQTDMIDDKEKESFQHRDVIPTSSIKLKTATLSSDVDGMSILSFDRTFVLVGLKGQPFSIIASLEFVPSVLPSAIRDEFYNIVVVELRKQFGSRENQFQSFNHIPSWLYDLHKLQVLIIDSYKLDEQFFERNSALERLIMRNLDGKSKAAIVEQVDLLQHLKYLVHDEIFTDEEVTLIHSRRPNLVILQESAYDKMIDLGEIPKPQF